MNNKITTVEEFNEKEKKEEERKRSIIDSVNNWINDYEDVETAKKKLEENTPNFLKRIREDIKKNEKERERKKEEERRIMLEKEQKYQNKKEKRDKINEDYGFTNDELFKMYHNEAKEADKVYKAFVTGGFSRLDKVNGRFLASQLIKLEVLNQQNNQIIKQNVEIIKLLKEISENLK